MTDMPWVPPMAGDEVEHLVGMLDRLRTTFRWKADDLDAAGLAQHVGVSALTLGGLLKHLAAVEDATFAWKLGGRHPGAQWDVGAWETNDQELLGAADDAPADLYRIWDEAVARSQQRLREAIASGGLDTRGAITDDDGTAASLRRILCDLVEEYGRHTGHADLLREAVDGRVGEDPPDGWRPAVGDPLTWLWRA